MYADSPHSFPYFQDPHQSYSSMDYSEYYLGGESDLFNAPDPIIEEPIMGIGAMMSCGENDIFSQVLKVSDIESIQCDQLLSEIFYECKKDILAKEENETPPLSDVFNIEINPFRTTVDEANVNVEDEKLLGQGPIFSKSVSSECLSSMHGTPVRPNFLDFNGVGAEFGAAYGMRRAFSEGDIEMLGNGNVCLVNSPRQLINSFPTENRMQKLSRYRNKKSKRNFGRKIKYACRKALADTQPRIRGRFAKTEE